MRISEAAAAAGVHIQTLRYYERRRLLAEPARRGAGYRSYDMAAAQRVRFIKRPQEVGFSPDEIRELLELRVQGRGAPAVRQLAVAKVRDIDERMRRLAAMRAVLSGLIDACGCNDVPRECPIIEALDDEPGLGASEGRSRATP